VLLADNMSWSGRVANRGVTDAETEGIRGFTRSVFADPDFVSTIVPLRDGVLVARRGESALSA
jgi:predicted O-methyltransferase YrrM